mmetsp:Transcript_6461/g.13784  ORF Transcript_6461/g.13784 Transcript_6461/m.13784 type:complete len:213 (-) Transcript_6461:8-646(-)
MMVQFMPTCIVSCWPSTSTVTLELAKNPQLPVENCFFPTFTLWVPNCTLKSLALAMNSFRVIRDACRSLAPDLGTFSPSFLAFFSGAWPDDFLPFRLEPADASASPSASPPSPSAPEPAASSSAAWASWMREISAVVSSLILSLRQSSSPGPLPRTFSSSARTSFREVFVRSLPFSTAEIVAASSSSGGMAADGSPMALPTTTARSPPRRVA